MIDHSRKFLIASIISICVYMANIVLGKLEVGKTIDTNIHLDGVPEFLLLLVATILFVISTLIKESAQKDDKTKTRGGEK